MVLDEPLVVLVGDNGRVSSEEKDKNLESHVLIGAIQPPQTQLRPAQSRTHTPEMIAAADEASLINRTRNLQHGPPMTVTLSLLTIR